MSNSLAVAMVTAALRRVLGGVLVAVPAGGVENTRVTTLRPDMLSAADGDARGINIFLYQVATNAALAGNMLPVRRADGSLLNRPEQALDLHYLLTFSGDENALEPQRMLGAAVTGLVAARSWTGSSCGISSPPMSPTTRPPGSSSPICRTSRSWSGSPRCRSVSRSSTTSGRRSSRPRTGSRSPTRPRWCCWTRT